MFNVQWIEIRAETESILNHMKNHKFMIRKEYKRIFQFVTGIRRRSYGEEEDVLNWEILMDCYDVVLTRKGIAFREKEEEEQA